MNNKMFKIVERWKEKHIGILDLVFDDKKSESVEWMPSPYSDHFVILIQIWYYFELQIRVKLDFYQDTYKYTRNRKNKNNLVT